MNLPYSHIAREYLIAEGLPADRTIVTGSPMREVLTHYEKGIAASPICQELGIKPLEYFLVSVHREENVDDENSLQGLVTLLNELAKRYALPIIVSTHPRTRLRLEALGAALDPQIRLCKPFGFFAYVHLQMNAKCVLSDSGTITEESSILNFPALNLRQSHERLEGFEEGAVMLVGLSPTRVMQALAILENQGRGKTRDLQMVADYAAQNVSDKVLRILLSYTDVIQTQTWKRSPAWE